MLKLTKTQRKAHKNLTKINKDSKFNSMIDTLTKGHKKVMDFINRGIVIQMKNMT
jgi:hypothetical protein